MLPKVQNQADFEQYIGQEIELIGIYRQLNVAQRQDRTAYAGRVFLELEDQERIALESNDLGIRTPEEIAEHEGKNVAIIGTLHNYTTLWGGGNAASIVMACLQNIQAIKKV